MPNPTPPQEEWEKELDKGWELWNYFHKHGTYTTCGEEVKSFIRSLLSKARAEAKKEAEECPLHHLKNCWCVVCAESIRENAIKEEREKVIKWAEENKKPVDWKDTRQSKSDYANGIGYNLALSDLLNYLKSK